MFLFVFVVFVLSVPDTFLINEETCFLFCFLLKFIIAVITSFAPITFFFELSVVEVLYTDVIFVFFRFGYLVPLFYVVVAIMLSALFLTSFVCCFWYR